MELFVNIRNASSMTSHAVQAVKLVAGGVENGNISHAATGEQENGLFEIPNWLIIVLIIAYITVSACAIVGKPILAKAKLLRSSDFGGFSAKNASVSTLSTNAMSALPVAATSPKLS